MEELGDPGTRQPLAPKRPAFPFDQSAPHPVGADIERVPQRKFQAIQAHRAEHPWLAAGSQTVQQQALRDFAQAMTAFFDPGNLAGRPRPCPPASCCAAPP